MTDTKIAIKNALKKSTSNHDDYLELNTLLCEKLKNSGVLTKPINLKWKEVSDTVKIGKVKSTYFVTGVNEDGEDEKWVFKTITKSGYKITDLMKDIIIQNIACLIVMDYNKRAAECKSKKVQMVWAHALVSESEILEIPSVLNEYGSHVYHYEHQIPSPRYEKYNLNNGGHMEEHINDVAQAVSHFSLLLSGGEYLLCDLQGASPIFTDPQIVTSTGNYSVFDLGQDAINNFVDLHTCNKFCNEMKLPSFVSNNLTQLVKKLMNTHLTIVSDSETVNTVNTSRTVRDSLTKLVVRKNKSIAKLSLISE